MSASSDTLQSPPQGTPGGKSSPVSAMSNYFKGVMAEFRLISWPTRPQVIAETLVVILVVTLFSLMMSLIDVLAGFLIKLITW
jgi:preprotein translocase SecE subunit